MISMTISGVKKQQVSMPKNLVKHLISRPARPTTNEHSLSEILACFVIGMQELAIPI